MLQSTSAPSSPSSSDGSGSSDSDGASSSQTSSNDDDDDSDFQLQESDVDDDHGVGSERERTITVSAANLSSFLLSRGIPPAFTSDFLTVSFLLSICSKKPLRKRLASGNSGARRRVQRCSGRGPARSTRMFRKSYHCSSPAATKRTPPSYRMRPPSCVLPFSLGMSAPRATN